MRIIYIYAKYTYVKNEILSFQLLADALYNLQ